MSCPAHLCTQFLYGSLYVHIQSLKLQWMNLRSSALVGLHYALYRDALTWLSPVATCYSCLVALFHSHQVDHLNMSLLMTRSFLFGVDTLSLLNFSSFRSKNPLGGWCWQLFFAWLKATLHVPCCRVCWRIIELIVLYSRFSFYDGPPFATGLPHYGHILAGTIKDIVTRFAHQSGFHVERRFGWDCHGLPVVSTLCLAFFLVVRLARLICNFWCDAALTAPKATRLGLFQNVLPPHHLPPIKKRRQFKAIAQFLCRKKRKGMTSSTVTWSVDMNTLAYPAKECLSSKLPKIMNF